VINACKSSSKYFALLVGEEVLKRVKRGIERFLGSELDADFLQPRLECIAP